MSNKIMGFITMGNDKNLGVDVTNSNKNRKFLLN